MINSFYNNNNKYKNISNLKKIILSFPFFVAFINPGINLRAAAINSNVSVSPRRYYHTYGDIIIHTTTSHTFVRVYNHE